MWIIAFTFADEKNRIFRCHRQHHLTLKAPIATKVVCFVRPLKFFIGAVYSGSTLFASMLNSSVMLGNYLQQTTSADDIFRCVFFLGALRANVDVQYLHSWHHHHPQHRPLSQIGEECEKMLYVGYTVLTQYLQPCADPEGGRGGPDPFWKIKKRYRVP